MHTGTQTHIDKKRKKRKHTLTDTHIGSHARACLYHVEAPVRPRLTCGRVQMDSQQSVTAFPASPDPFVTPPRLSSLPILRVPRSPGQVLHSPQGAQMDGLSLHQCVCV